MAMHKYRRAYLEITSRCNLNCSFCVKGAARYPDLSFGDFTRIADQLRAVTGTLYYHILGEPLLHKNLERMMAYAQSRGLKSAITTNGLGLKDKIGKWSGLRIARLNVSLQAYFDPANGLSMADAINTVQAAEQLQKETGCVVFFRLWDMENPADREMAAWLEGRYRNPIDPLQARGPNGFPIRDWIRVQEEKRFVWPPDAEKGTREGFCEGLRTHFGILADGTVVPCCLDAKGQLALGNCLKEPLTRILEGPRAAAIYRGFTEHYAKEPLCAKCEYKQRFQR